MPKSLSNSSIVAFRILFGFFIAYDLIAHFSDVLLLYTDAGLFPVQYAKATLYPHQWSLYLFSGNPFFVVPLYCLHILVALLFMGGIAFPLTPVLLFALQLSLRNRNYAISDAGDDLTIAFSFFSIFLFRPLQHSLWQFVFVVQTLCIYHFSALLKSSAAWSSTYLATEQVFRLDTLANTFGKFLLRFPDLLKAATASIFYLEFWGPVVFFFSFIFHNKASIKLRRLICIIFILFHLALAAALRLGVFPFLCIALWVALYPRENDQAEPAPPTSRLTTALIGLLAILTITSIVYKNLNGIDKRFEVPRPMQIFLESTSLIQNWQMFAPAPPSKDSPIEAIGILPDQSTRSYASESFWQQNRHRIKYRLNMNLRRKDFMESYLLYLCNQPPHAKKIELRKRHENELIWAQECPEVIPF